MHSEQPDRLAEPLHGIRGQPRGRAIAWVTIGAMLAAACFYLLQVADFRVMTAQPPVVIDAAQMTIRQGSVAAAGARLHLGGGTSRMGLAAAPTRTVVASEYDLARATVVIPPGAESKVAFVWLRSDQEGRVFSAPLAAVGANTSEVVLAGLPEWRGRIVAAGLGVLDGGAQPVEVRALTLVQRSALGELAHIVSAWLSPELWSSRSINFVVGGNDSARLHPVEALGALALVGIGAAWIYSRYRKARLGLAFALVVLMAMTLLLDLRWQWNLWRADTHALDLSRLDWAARRSALPDGPLFDLAQDVKKVMGQTPQRILVFSDVIFVKAKTAYFLLPHDAYYHRNSEFLPKADQLRLGDWILLIRKGNVVWDAERSMLAWDDQKRAAELVLQRPGALLFKVK